MSIKTATTLTPKIFLPYQIKWLKDKSQIKIWRKSRRIGATYVQAFEDVIDALTLKIRGKVCDVWFSSADITAAKEYIMYCEYWAKLLNFAMKIKASRRFLLNLATVPELMHCRLTRHNSVQKAVKSFLMSLHTTKTHRHCGLRHQLPLLYGVIRSEFYQLTTDSHANFINL